MYVCQNKNHDGDRKIPPTVGVFETDGQIWCRACTLRAMNPEPTKPAFVDHHALGIGLNAAEQKERGLV